jgi:hypothetical protein
MPTAVTSVATSQAMQQELDVSGSYVSFLAILLFRFFSALCQIIQGYFNFYCTFSYKFALFLKYRHLILISTICSSNLRNFMKFGSSAEYLKKQSFTALEEGS